MELCRAAVERFPRYRNLYQRLGCCSGNQELFDDAIAASQRALEIDPDSQNLKNLVNDFGWSMFQAGRLEEAEELLLKAVSMDPSDELARENLRLCQSARSEL